MKTVKVLLVMATFAILAACGGPVDAVKNGRLELDNSVTVGQAIEAGAKKMNATVEWLSKKDDASRVLVGFTWHGTTEGKNPTVWFVVKDKEFEIYGIEYDEYNGKLFTESSGKNEAYRFVDMFYAASRRQ